MRGAVRHSSGNGSAALVFSSRVPPTRGTGLADESLVRTLIGLNNVQNGVNQRQVRQRLREVAEMTCRLRVELFAEESEGTRGTDQLLTVGAGSFQLTDFDQCGHQPERTDGKGSFVLAPHTIVGRL